MFSDSDATLMRAPGKPQQSRPMKTTLKQLSAVLFTSALWLMSPAAHAQTFNTLHPFSGGSDGASPYGTLTLSRDGLFNLWGTAALGGASNYGTIFMLKTDGTGFVSVHEFDGIHDGRVPKGRLLLSGSTVYGT